MRVRSDRHECAACGIAHRQTPSRDAEVRAMKRRAAALDHLLQPGKGHEVIETVADRSLLEPLDIVSERRIAARSKPLRGRLDQGHPPADEIAGRYRLAVLDE